MTEIPAKNVSCNVLARASSAILVIWTLACLMLWIKIAFYAPIPNDDGYYLYQAKLIAEDGLIPIRDFEAHYSPGSIYLLAAVMTGFGKNYSAMMIFILLLSSSTIWMISRDVLKRNNSFTAALISSSFMIPAWLIYGGAQPFLEPLLIFFAVAAYRMLRSDRFGRFNRWFLSGFLFGMSIMCKQFAIVFVLAATIEMIFIERKGSLKDFSLILILFWLGVSIPFLVFCIHAGLPIFSTAYYIANLGHASYGFSIASMEAVIQYFLRMYGVSVPILLSFFWVLLKHRTRYRLPLMLFIGGAVFLRFQTFDHYYLMIIPWGTLFVVQAVRDLSLKLAALPRRYTVIMTLTAAVLFGYPILEKGSFYTKRLLTTGKLFRSFYGGLHPESRNLQYEKAREIDGWEISKPVIILGDATLQYLANTRIAENHAHYGFTLYPEMIELLKRGIDSGAEFIIIEALPDRRRVTDMKEYLIKHGFKIVRVVTIENDVLTHLKRTGEKINS